MEMLVHDNELKEEKVEKNIEKVKESKKEK